MSKVIFNNQEWTRLLISNLKIKNVAIDATMGNGYDTVYLAQNFDKVYSFDIQELALENTKYKLNELDLTNTELILDSHSRMDIYVQAAQCIIFNLGYLPSSNKLITTNSITTIEAIDKACQIIDVQGVIILTLYQAHDQSLEANEVVAHLHTLDPKKYLVHHFVNVNRHLPPFVMTIERLK